MWLIVIDDDRMDILSKREVLAGDWSQWKINLNDEKKEFVPIILDIDIKSEG